MLEGNFASGETVGIYREPNYAVTSRIGLDAVSLNAPAAYTAEGVIASYKVNDGDSVKKGDVLFETFEGVYSGSEAPTGAVVSPVDGVVASVELSQGTDAAPGSAAFTVYPDSAMRLEAQVAESELKFFAVGGKVTVEPAYADGDEAISGAIERISLLGSETDESGEAYYSVFIIPEDAASLYYGMHVVISLQ